MNEQRRSRRKRAQHGIEVTNSLTGEQIGCLGNLSSDGMLLVANRVLSNNSLYQLAFELPGAGASAPRRLEIGVHEQWSEPASRAGQYWAGCRIIDIAPDDRKALTAWVETRDKADT